MGLYPTFPAHYLIPYRNLNRLTGTDQNYEFNYIDFSNRFQQFLNPP